MQGDASTCHVRCQRQEEPCAAGGKEPEGPAPPCVEVVYLPAEDLAPLANVQAELRVRAGGAALLSSGKWQLLQAIPPFQRNHV